LEVFEAVQRLLDSHLAQPTRAIADPGPLLHQQLLPLAIGLEVDHGDDFDVEGNLISGPTQSIRRFQR